METNKINDLLTEFSKDILKQFEAYCAAREMEINCENLLQFLIGCSLLPKKEINQFIVITCYPKILAKEKGQKMRAVAHMESIVPYHKTHIDTILKHYSKKFRFNKNNLL